MLQALINLFKTKSEEKVSEVKPEPPVLTEVVPKEPAEVKEPVAEIKPTEPEIQIQEVAPIPSQMSPVETVPNFVVEVPVEIHLPVVEPNIIAEPVTVKDEVKVEVEKKPKRGRPKTGSKPKSTKKK